MRPKRLALIFPLAVLVFPEISVADRAETLKREFADRAYAIAGEKFADDLSQQGLSPSDSRSIARSGFYKVASCLIDAALVQSEVEVVPQGDVLDAIEQTIDELDSPSIDDRLARGLLDEGALAEIAAPCLLDVAQEAGIATD